ncbi:PLD nuclease N-terminal domain-containing protein [Thermodesulfobacteriota bacterium]
MNEDLKFILIVIAVSIPCFFLTVWAIVDSFQREFSSTGKKALWMIIAALPFFGFIVYFLFGLRQGKKPA